MNPKSKIQNPKSIIQRLSSNVYRPVFFTIFTIITLAFVATGVVSAQTSDTFNIDDNINLQPIVINIFPQLLPDTRYATVLSWLSFAGSIFSIGLIIFWVYLVIRAAFVALSSQENAEGIQDAYARMKSTLIGASFALVIPIILMVIGGVLGLGPIWTWPVALQDCPASDEYDYYFQALLNSDGNQNAAKDLCGIEYRL